VQLTCGLSPRISIAVRARPDLRDKASIRDLLLQPHSAPPGMTVYQAPQGAAHAFPEIYDADVFVALHGSWNRATRTGTKVVRILMKDGAPTGSYEDFMTGLIISDSAVWGRPCSVAVAPTAHSWSTMTPLAPSGESFRRSNSAGLTPR
jgi:glucose/arabinose dehydrogenase